MAIEKLTAALGLADVKVSPWVSGSTYGDAIDIPKIVQFEHGAVVGGKELEGDDTVEQYSYIKNYQGKLAFNKIPLTVLEKVFGGAVASAGDTPNEIVTFTWPAVGTAMPRFKIEGRATKVDSGIGDAHVIVTGCMVKPGNYPITLSYDNFASVTVDIFIADQPQIKLYETAASISAGAADTTPPTVTTVPADAAENFVITANLTATFSEEIQEGDVTGNNFVLMKASDGSVVAGALTLNALGTIVTFDPTESLSVDTEYIWIITGVRDLAGNVLDGPTVVNFTTAA